MGGTGVQRVKSFFKYLPYYNVKPNILTISAREKHQEIDTKSQMNTCGDVYKSFCLDFYSVFRVLNIKTLKDRHKSATSVYSYRGQSSLNKIVDIYNKVMVPDAKLFWLPFAFNKSKSIFASHNIDAVLSTSPRATAHLIAYLISKKYKVPMISDFRDPWTQGKLEVSRPFPFKAIDVFLEKTIIQHSHKVISVTNEIRNDFINRYKSLPQDKFEVVTNGYDLEEFQSVQPEKFDHFTILYAGKNYDGYGNILYFLEKLGKINKRNRFNIIFHYVGSDHQIIS
jgi:glycosyltransferase involved in cell wall biosynthesis